MTTTPVQKHVFETAKLGQAPYHYLGCEKAIYVACPGAPMQPGATCQYCGTGIMYKFWLQSADGKRFFVGSDCIIKSGDLGLKNVIDADVKRLQKEVRDSRNQSLVETFEAFLKVNPDFWTRDVRPHPVYFYAKQGKTMGDYRKFCYEHSGLSSKATIARQLLIAAGVELPASKRGKSKAAASAASPSTGTRKLLNP